MLAFSTKIKDFSYGLQLRSSRSNLFDLFDKSGHGYYDNQMDIEIESENYVLDYYQCLPVVIDVSKWA